MGSLCHMGPWKPLSKMPTLWAPWPPSRPSLILPLSSPIWSETCRRRPRQWFCLVARTVEVRHRLPANFFLLCQCGLHLVHIYFYIFMADFLFRIFLYPFCMFNSVGSLDAAQVSSHCDRGSSCFRADLTIWGHRPQWHLLQDSERRFQGHSLPSFTFLFLLLFHSNLNVFQCLVFKSLDVRAARKYELFRLHPTIVECHRQDCLSKWWSTWPQHPISHVPVFDNLF